jgi:hypothetical protein
MKRSSPCKNLMNSFCRIQSLDVPVRFLFESNLLLEHHTPQDFGTKNGDIIVAFLPQSGSIGVYVAASDIVQLHCGTACPATSAPGAQWLAQPSLPAPLPHPEDVAALVRSFHHRPIPPTASRPPCSQVQPAFSCVSEAACVALRRRVDHAHALAFSHQVQDHAATQALAPHNTVTLGVAATRCEGDFRLRLTLHELATTPARASCQLLKRTHPTPLRFAAPRPAAAGSTSTLTPPRARCRRVFDRLVFHCALTPLAFDPQVGASDGRRLMRRRAATVRVQ